MTVRTLRPQSAHTQWQIRQFVDRYPDATASEIAQGLDLNRNTLSSHLRSMVNRQLLARHGDGPATVYRSGPVDMPRVEPVARTCNRCGGLWATLPEDPSPTCEHCVHADDMHRLAIQAQVQAIVVRTPLKARCRATDPHGRPAWIDTAGDITALQADQRLTGEIQEAA